MTEADPHSTHTRHRIHICAGQQGQEGLVFRNHLQCSLAAVGYAPVDLYSRRAKRSVEPIYGFSRCPFVRLSHPPLAYVWSREELHLNSQRCQEMVWSRQARISASGVWNCVSDWSPSSWSRDFEWLWIFDCVGYQRSRSTPWWRLSFETEALSFCHHLPNGSLPPILA